MLQMVTSFPAIPVDPVPQPIDKYVSAPEAAFLSSLIVMESVP